MWRSQTMVWRFQFSSVQFMRWTRIRTRIRTYRKPLPFCGWVHIQHSERDTQCKPQISTGSYSPWKTVGVSFITNYGMWGIHNVQNTTVQTNSVLLGQVLNHCSRIRSHRQQADHRSSRVTLIPHGSQIQDHWISVLRSHRVGDVLARLRRCSVWAPWSSACIQTTHSQHHHTHAATVRILRILKIS